MNTPNNDYLGTVDIMQAMQDFLIGLVLVPQAGDTPAVPLFENVQFYSSPDLVKAFQELRSFQNRVCLIIPSGEEYTDERQGNSLTVHCTRILELLICDRDQGKRQQASTGSGDPAHPGVLVMKDLLENQLIAQNFSFAPRLLRTRPQSGQPFKLVDKDRANLPGRLGWQMTWHVDAGDRVFTCR